MTARNKILKSLKDNGGLTPSRIAGLNGLSYTFTTEILKKLRKEKLVVSKDYEKFTVWEITKKGILINGKNRILNRTIKTKYKNIERDILYKKQEGKCNSCKVKLDDRIIDHIIPLSLGGNNNMDNKQLLCMSCNSKKAIEDLKNIWKNRKEAKGGIK